MIMMVGIVLTVVFSMIGFLLLVEQKEERLHDEIERKSKEYTEQLREKLKKENEENEQNKRASDRSKISISV